MQTDYNYETRFNVLECLGIPRYSRTKCQNSFVFRGIKCWNALNLEIKTSKNLKTFQRCIKIVYWDEIYILPIINVFFFSCFLLAFCSSKGCFYFINGFFYRNKYVFS